MLRRGLLVLALLVAVVPFAASPAFATGASDATSSTYAGKADCGSPDTSFQVSGHVNFHRSRNLVTIHVYLTNATPGAAYNVFFFANPPCGLEGLIGGSLGTVNTNSRGIGHGNFHVMVPAADTMFFADPTTASTPFVPFSNDTTTVTLAA